MSSEEFHALLDQYAWESEVDRRDEPLTLARLAELERQKGVRFPAFYKEFLSMYGAGDFGSITVLSPDPRSEFPIWETTPKGQGGGKNWGKNECKGKRSNNRTLPYRGTLFPLFV